VQNVANRSGFGPGTIEKTQVNDTDPSKGSVGTGSTASVGVAGQVGQIPNTTLAAIVGVTLITVAIAESLHEFIPKMSDEDAEVFLAEVQSKLRELVNKTDNNEVENKSEARQRQAEEQKKKLDDAQKKLQEIIDARKSGDIGALIKLAFEMILLAFQVLAVVMTGGALAPAFFANPMNLQAINDATKQFTGLGIAGNIDKLINPNDKASWAKADMGFGMALMGAMVIATIAMMAIGVGEAEMPALAGQLAEAGTTLSESTVAVTEGVTTAVTEGAEIAKATETLSQLQKLMNLLTDPQKIMSWARDIPTVMDAVGNLAAAPGQFIASETQAEAKKDQARAKEMAALLKRIDEMLDLAIKRLANNGDRWAKMLQGTMDAMRDRGDHLSRASLTA
jgi:hypothetical protein